MRHKKEKFISIRTRMFLQVGVIVLIAMILILLLNNSLLPNIYTRNEMRTMKEAYTAISEKSYTDSDFSQTVSNIEKMHRFSIDIYLNDGTPLYLGTDDLFSGGGKFTVVKRSDDENGADFQILENEQTKKEYIVYNAKFDGAEIEIYSQKETIDETARIATLITSVTSITALLLALVYIYFYTGKFTKPLIEMSRVTENMSEMDFSNKCKVKGNDEISQLSQSINNMSDSLDETLKDLSEKNKKLEADIEKEKTLEKIRRDFISNVSHELKTPISIIRGYSEGAGLMLESGDSNGAKDYCDIIVNETEKMNVLVLQLLELSRYESGSIEIEQECFNIFELIDDYASGNEINFKEKGISFSNEIDKNIIGIGDTVKLEMVINNYISNAVSHADGEKKISVTSEDLGDRYRIKVFNTGKSVADDDIDKIWISFYRADKSRSRSEGRFGLGLSIVSAIQKLHNQEYGCYNTDDGVCFWFDIKKAE